MAEIIEDAVVAGSQWRARSFSVNDASDAAAVAAIRQRLNGLDIALLVLFISSERNRESLAQALNLAFPGVPMAGCTTAGEIGELGYGEGSITGVAFSVGDLTFEVALMDKLSGRDFREMQKFADDVRLRLLARLPEPAVNRCFGFMLVDGMCGREESLARAFHDGLGGMQLLGGSAGDGLQFKQTFVMLNGRFHSDAAVLLVAHTDFPFVVFKTQHFVCGSDRMVVTRADSEQRVVHEINGCSAAEEYSRAIGVAIDYLDPMVFAAYPVLVRIGDADFVRSIQKVNPDGSLTFFCAIDEGIVFRVAESVGMHENLNDTFEAIRQKLGKPALILGCDCILRNLEASRRGWRSSIGDMLARSQVVGFSTYGEQFRGMHVNQTLTGIAFGTRKGQQHVA